MQTRGHAAQAADAPRRRDPRHDLRQARPDRRGDLPAAWRHAARRRRRRHQLRLDHCGRHGITSDIQLIVPAQINEAYERTLKGDVKHRLVIDCSKF